MNLTPDEIVTLSIAVEHLAHAAATLVQAGLPCNITPTITNLVNQINSSIPASVNE